MESFLSNDGVVGRLALIGIMLLSFHCYGPASPPPGPPLPNARGCGTADFSQCACDLKADCVPSDQPERAKYFVCTPRKRCIPICLTDSDCAAGQVCEDSECRAPGCATSDECGTGLTCQSGVCAAPSALGEVASCEVTPPAAVLHTGVTRSFQLVARDQAGNVLSILPAAGDVTWDADDTGTLAADTQFATLTGGGSAASGVLQASIGSVPCTGATVTNFAAVPEGQFRVVVASKEDHVLVSDARVSVNGQELSHGEGGSYVFESVTTPATVMVSHPTRSNVMLVDVSSSDVLVDLKSEHPLVKLSGEMTYDSFEELRDRRGTVHVAFARANFVGNLNNLNPMDLLGNDSVETVIDFGGTAKLTTRFGEGLVMGLAANMFKTKHSVSARTGSHTVTMVGGNLMFSDVLSFVGPRSDDTGAVDLFVGLLPLLGSTQFAALPFQPFSEDAPLSLRPQEPLRVRATASVAALPSYEWNSEHVPLEEVMLLGGLRHPSQGFVPVGFSAAFDGDSNGLLDPPMSGVEGDVPFRMASVPQGLDRSPYQVVAMVLEKNKLSGERTRHPMVVSGMVTSPAPRHFKDDAASVVTLPAALSFPQQVALDVVNDRFEHSGLNEATMMQLELGNGWTVFFPATRKVVDLSGLPLDEHTTATLHALRLGQRSGVDYQSVLRFDGDDLDDLNGVMDAFSVRPLTANEVAR